MNGMSINVGNANLRNSYSNNVAFGGRIKIELPKKLLCNNCKVDLDIFSKNVPKNDDIFNIGKNSKINQNNRTPEQKLPPKK